MKKTLTLLIVLFAVSCYSQVNKIETQSVSIDNLITHIVENFENKKGDSLSETHNLTFLIEVSEEPTAEDKTILKQAFRLLSRRLTAIDTISIVAYKGLNGIALRQTSATDLKKINYALNNLKSTIDWSTKDGINVGYNYASENFDDTATNIVIMVRNENAAISIDGISKNSETLDATPKKRNNTVLLTAIGLLPEIITLIKD